MFEKLKAIILSVLAIDKLPVSDNKLALSDEQKNLIEKEFSAMGDDFLKKFTDLHDKTMKDSSASEKLKATEAEKKEIEASQEKLIASIKAENKKEIDGLNAKIEKLIKASEGDQGVEADDVLSIIDKGSGAKGFAINPKALHNTIAEAYLAGDSGPFLAAADNTIDVADLKSEFGVVTTKDKNFIRRKLTAKTMTQKFMTVKLAEEEWRASEGLVSSVVQQFVAKWTPLGEGKFTPIAIKNRRHKINVEFTPDDITGTWISTLYDEGLTPKEMPITKLMINMIIDKAAEDRELLLIGKGRYEELNKAAVSEGDAGQPTGKSMDGYLTILEKEYENPATKVSFIKLGIITKANHVDKMNNFVDGIDVLYKGKKLPLFCSHTKRITYKRAYQEEYPNTKNEDNSDIIDFSNNRLQVLDSMAGSTHFFITPKDNFILLNHKNKATSKIFIENLSMYKVQLAAEWREAVGFALAEPVFAYVDPIAVINRYAVEDDASKLHVQMLEDAEITSVDESKLAAYKTAIAAADGIADKAALQAIIDTVNAA